MILTSMILPIRIFPKCRDRLTTKYTEYTKAETSLARISPTWRDRLTTKYGGLSPKGRDRPETSGNTRKQKRYGDVPSQARKHRTETVCASARVIAKLKEERGHLIEHAIRDLLRKSDVELFRRKQSLLEKVLGVKVRTLCIISASGFTSGALSAARTSRGLWLVDATRLRALFRELGTKPPLDGGPHPGMTNDQCPASTPET